MNCKKVLGLIPARGGSKGVPRKNIKEMCGRPLISYTIEAALQSTVLDMALVSTDDKQIREKALKWGETVPFMRPHELAQDETPMEPVVEHTIEHVKNNYEGNWKTVVILQPTSPLRDEGDIDGALEKYKSGKCDSLVSVEKNHSYRWKKEEQGAQRINYPEDRIPRQGKSPEFVENGAIYISDIHKFLENEKITCGRTCLFRMDDISSVDIDTPFELWIAKKIMEEW